MSKNKWTPVLLITICLCIAGCGRMDVEDTKVSYQMIPSEKVNYKTVTVEYGNYVETDGSSVSVMYPVEAKVFWKENNACIREICVKRGDQVKEGDVLAVLAIDDQEVDLTEVKLALLRAQEALERERQERQAEIAKAVEDSVTAYEYNKVVAELKIEKQKVLLEEFEYQAGLEIERLKEEQERLEAIIAESVLTAPFDGVINFVENCDPGDRVVPGQVLITLYSSDKFFLQADNELLDGLRYNNDVIIETGNKKNRQMYNGRVVSSPNILPIELRQEYVLIAVEEGVSSDIFTDSASQLYESISLQNVMVVDGSAVQKEENKFYVLVLEDGIVRKRYVKVGAKKGKLAWILEGLEEGQTLILN